MKPKSALNLFVCKCLTLHPFTFRHFYYYVFLKGCENMCNYHTAQQLRTIEKKESRAELSGDIAKMMTKSFPGWVSSHSTSKLTTGINLPDPGRHLI